MIQVADKQANPTMIHVGHADQLFLPVNSCKMSRADPIGVYVSKLQRTFSLVFCYNGLVNAKTGLL